MIDCRGRRRAALISTAAVAALAVLTASGAYAQAAAVAFDIPAEDLGAALRAFGKQSGRQITFDGAAVRGKTSAAVKGSLTAEEALARLLAGSGLRTGHTASGVLLVQEGGPLPPGDAAGTTAADVSEVTVTGTRARNGVVTAPVTTIDRDMIANAGRATVGEVLSTLPQVFSGGQSPTNIGGRGIGDSFTSTFSTLPNLRGLGADSTLTLIDGHRLAFDSNVAGSDISIVPSAAVKRIDVETDGASALYGSDAVAGVVNVILRDDFVGNQSQVRLGGTTDGGRAEQTYSHIFGTGWTGGGLTVSAEYHHADPIDAADRRFAVAVAPGVEIAPRQEDLNLFLAGHQDLSEQISVYVRSLAAHRNSDLAFASGTSVYDYDSSLFEAASLVGVKVRLPAGWSADVSANYGGSNNHFNQVSVSRTSGAVIPSASSTKNTVGGVDLDLEGPLARLPAGDLRLAFGGGYRRETYKGSSSGHFTRDVDYGYAELSAPLVARDPDRKGLVELAANAAVRYESYSDFGSAVSPKVGL
ncbi:MAG: TonB-dependent receptor, partial [Proteobacteria bacterium]|nr:TonB-dependent receptor [Pseudomonadota bacterium]